MSKESEGNEKILFFTHVNVLLRSLLTDFTWGQLVDFLVDLIEDFLWEQACQLTTIPRITSVPQFFGGCHRHPNYKQFL